MEREKKGGRAHFFDVDIFFVCVVVVFPPQHIPKKIERWFLYRHEKMKSIFFGWDKNSADVTWEIPLGSS